LPIFIVVAKHKSSALFLSYEVYYTCTGWHTKRGHFVLRLYCNFWSI